MHAGVQQDQFTGDGACTRQQPHHGFGHVLGRAGALQRRGAFIAGFQLFVGLLADAVLEPAGGDEARAYRASARARCKVMALTAPLDAT
jgi:hypothetical protein